MQNIRKQFHILLSDFDLRRKHAQNFGRRCYCLFRFMLLFGIGFIILYPFLYMLSMAFRPIEQVYDPSIFWIPKSLTLSNFAYAIQKSGYWASLGKTFGLTLLSTLIQCASCSTVGYGFAKFRFYGKGILFALVLFTLMIPPQTVTIPLFSNYSNFNFFGIGEIGKLFGGEVWTVPIINTIWPNVIATVTCHGLRAGLFVYLFRSYYSGLPAELEDAAYIDGTGFFGTYLRVMLPNAGPIILVTFLLTFVWYWNDYQYSSLLLNEFGLLSVTLGNVDGWLPGTPSDPQRILGLQSAALLLVTPILILYVILQRRFAESVVKSGIVG